MEKVVVAMSGGVDSCVAVALLKEKGYEGKERGTSDSRRIAGE